MKSLGGGLGRDFLRTGILRPEECLRYGLSLSVSIRVSGTYSIETLEKNLKISFKFTPITEEKKELAGEKQTLRPRQQIRTLQIFLIV